VSTTTVSTLQEQIDDLDLLLDWLQPLHDGQPELRSLTSGTVAWLSTRRYQLLVDVLGLRSQYTDSTPVNRFTTPAGDHRERAVPCGVCGTHTWNIAALCDRHLEVA
jgi:hypothetical protein